MKKANAHVFNGNAVEFTDYGRCDFLYFHNPFPAKVMRQTIARVQRLSDPARELVIIDNTPACHDLVVGHGFTPMREYPDQWGNGIRVYSNRPQTSRLLAKSRAPLRQRRQRARGPASGFPCVLDWPLPSGASRCGHTQKEPSGSFCRFNRRVTF